MRVRYRPSVNVPFGTLFIYIFLLHLKCGGVLSLRHVRAWSPLAVERGKDAVLRCLYDLEADTLYSVKWYRGDREFCRYSPREVPPLKVFPLAGVDVDAAESDAERLTLRAVSRGAAGRYTCEVSADAPSFHTALVNTTLAVVELPHAGPALRGIKPRYRAGSRLRGDCVCRDSQPAANLTFFINDTPAAATHVRHHVLPAGEGLHTASATVSFLVRREHFLHGKLKVRCTASIYMLYWRSTEKSSVEVEATPRDADAGAAPPPDPQRVALVYPAPAAAAPPPPHSHPPASSGASCLHHSFLLCILVIKVLATSSAFKMPDKR